MILTDSNVFIDYWKNPTAEMKDIFLHNEIAVCGIIKTELLRGCNSQEEFEQITNALECFGYCNIEENDWPEIAQLFIKLRQNGVTVPFQDGVIAFLAIKNKFKLWTNDKHFKLIQVVEPELQLVTH